MLLRLRARKHRPRGVRGARAFAGFHRDCAPPHQRLPWCCAALQTAGYAGLLVAAPTVLYEIIAYVLPGLTKSERSFLAPVIFGSSILFYFG